MTILSKEILISPVGDLLLRNVIPSHTVLISGPFKRMRYEEAIEWLAESKDSRALNKDGEPHVFGMDIEEGNSEMA